jgi:hypothetical protein
MSLIFYKNKYNISITNSKGYFLKKDIIIKILYKLYLVILKNKLKKNIFLKLWYGNLYNVLYLIVELLKFNVSVVGGSEIFLIFINIL